MQAVFASDVFYLLTLYLSKCCAASTYLRLTPKKAHNVASWALMGLSTLWVFTSVLAIGINCELEHPWMNIAKQCSDMVGISETPRRDLCPRLIVVLVCPMASYYCIRRHYRSLPLRSGYLAYRRSPDALATKVVRVDRIRLSFDVSICPLTRYRDSNLVSRLIAVAIVRLHYLNIGIHSSNLTLDGAEAVIWTQVEVQYSVIALVIACLNSFLKVVNTEYGTGTAENNLEYSTGGSNSRSKAQVSAASFSMNSMNKSGRHDKVSIKVGKRAASKSRSIDEADQNHQSFRPDNTQHWTTVTTGQNRDANSIASNDSRKIIIKKQVAYTVEHEWEPGMEEER